MFLRKINVKNIYHKIRYYRYIKEGIFVDRNVDIVNSNIKKNARLAYHCSVRNANIGNFSSIGRYSKINYTDIGKFCSISWDITIGASNHPLDRITTHGFTYNPALGFVDKFLVDFPKVTIGNDVWIGCNSVILPNIEIGDGAIIGAGTVVTKDVPPYAIVVGNPGKIIRYRYNEDIIERLLELKWWNWPDWLIKENLHLFQSEFDTSILEEFEDINKKRVYKL